MATRSMKVLKTLADNAFEPEKKPKQVIPKKKDESNYEVIMTKEEIEQYIDLDNKIKNRIVQISHALKSVKSTIISKFVPGFRYWNLADYDKEDFIENSQQDEELHLGLDCYDDDSWECNFDKSLLMLTDEQIIEIVEYDRKKKEEDNKRQKEAEKARQERLKKDVEEKEYEQYLRLKKKFEKE